MPEKYNFTNVLDVTTSNISWELHLKSVNLFMTDKQKDDIFSSFITDEISDFNSNVYYMILSILVYTFFSRMFDLMLPPVAKHSIVVA